MKRYILIIYIFVFVQLAGCSNLGAISAGKIGCAPDKVKISEENTGWSSKTWVATCNEKRFICTGHTTGQYSTQVDCTPEQQ